MESIGNELIVQIAGFCFANPPLPVRAALL